MGEDLEDFEALLEPKFSAKQFTNDLLKVTNGESTSTELDVGTAIKKINYDLAEVDSQINQLIHENPLPILNQIYKGKAIEQKINDGLKPSFEYLTMSYKRLQQEILEPYERAQKLQSVLSKVHQTSILLRDALIYVHLMDKIQRLTEPIDKLTIERAVQLAALYSQLQMSLNQNANLKSLQLIKQLEGATAESKKNLLGFLSLNLSKESLNSFKVKNNSETVSSLAHALYIVSVQEFVSTIQKIILTNVLSNSQILTRTINSIKNFPLAFEDVVRKSYDIYLLETILHGVKIENSNLLIEYATHRKPKTATPRELYWTKIASNFKKEFEISYNRGGPVGKSLLRNQDLIIETIQKQMPNSTGNDDYQQNLEIMLKSISILSSSKNKSK
ncbi:hypothetical protein NCAS_0G03100 [Naumovozyma castellii]|uniref:Conserved oligomeric Golgi complex subunit 5 n=1 Tax=Naumovozyma castellii TaxID=27288 RepID=G0VIG2_NAUCA|nr:hypothetical protein NCAS_0G03100 [Naumovozyma castellii CBS 4309]CCC71197.1 hypothetical protein NCAS_0G03100 [Naumovozyma castellii CBS 4309]